MADVVRQDEEIFGDVQRRAGAKEHVGEDGVQQRVGTAAGAVQQEDGVIDAPGRVAMNCSQGEVVQLELGQRFADAEAEVGENGGSVHCGPCGDRRGLCGG